MSENFEDSESLSTPAMEDLLRFWEEFSAIASIRTEEVRQALRRRYEKEEVSYYFTDYGFIRGHN